MPPVSSIRQRVRHAEVVLRGGVSLLGFGSERLNIGLPGQNSRSKDRQQRHKDATMDPSLHLDCKCSSVHRPVQ